MIMIKMIKLIIKNKKIEVKIKKKIPKLNMKKKKMWFLILLKKRNQIIIKKKF